MLTREYRGDILIKHIVIVGGGIGGTMTANTMASKIYREICDNQVRIALISDSPWHYYKPSWMYVAFDMFFNGETKKLQSGLLRPEINFVIYRVEAFSFKDSNLRTGKRRKNQL